MKKHSSPPTMAYYGTLGLMVLELIGGAVSAIYALQNLFNGQPYALLLGCTVVCGCALMVTNALYRKLRDLVEYDEFGQSRKHNDFSKLSAAERRKIEEAKMIDSERLLPSSELNSMIHKGSNRPEEEIDELIGLPQVKTMMRDLAAQMLYDQKYGNKKDMTDRSYHMCFSGPPGTGKTTVARILTGLLYKYKVIRENKCLETDGNTFRGTTSAEATAKTQKILRKASGGLLFIDEAYALVDGGSGSNREVVATLIKEMEDNRDGVVVILAGYQNEMKAMIETNPGFKSRIQQYFYFDPYTLADLQAIFTSMANKAGYEVSPIGHDRFAEIITPMMNGKHFGNGRTVRNILQSSIDKHKVNCVKETDLSKEEQMIRNKTLVYEDIVAPRTI